MMGVSAKDKIGMLIEQAESPKDKAYLLITLQLVDAIQDNTELTKRIAEDLEKHRKDFIIHEQKEQALINTGRGMYRTALFFVGFLQICLVGTGSLLVKDYMALRTEVYQTLRTRVSDVEAEMKLHKEHHRYEEQVKKSPVQIGP